MPDRGPGVHQAGTADHQGDDDDDELADGL